jgi:GntR family transcriptional repressor for pyruvate dehydrogenase complex
VSVHPLFAARGAATLSAKIVAEVREALFEGRWRPGDFLGTEKEIAARHDVSRIVARDALRTLEAQGVIEIKPGSGGGARISRGDPRRFAESLAVQLQLAGIEAEDILAAQHAVECLAAELAAERATGEDQERLRALIAEAETLVEDADAFTRSSLRFHLAVAEASRNRVLYYQLVSLQHVSWPTRNRTLTRSVAKRILQAHRELAELIAARDAAGARALMDGHVRMIRNRRVSESKAARAKRQNLASCC